MVIADKLIFVGVISSAYGIKGEILVRSFTEPIENISKFILSTEVGETIKLSLVRKNDAKSTLICKLKDINTRTEAEKLKGCKLFTLRSCLPKLTSNEFYIADLKKLTVVDLNLKCLGVISNVLNFGASDIIEIQFINGKIELLPFTKEFFPVVNENYVIVNYKFEN